MSRACFSVIKYENGERPTNKQQGLTEHLTGGNTAFGDAQGF